MPGTMRSRILRTLTAVLWLVPAATGQTAAENDPIKTLVARLDLQRYKATVRGLTKFGDRRQGTDRNRAAIDWIEAQLKSYGCVNTERIHYTYEPPAAGAGRGAGGGRGGAGGGRGGRGAPGGAKLRGELAPTAVNNDPDLQPDTRIRELNAQPSTPGPREEVYGPKVGSTPPEEMYLVGAHMDPASVGRAANDDGSGTALVMESRTKGGECGDGPLDRFALWNNGSGTRARAYAGGRICRKRKSRDQASIRAEWLGMIQHDR